MFVFYTSSYGKSFTISHHEVLLVLSVAGLFIKSKMIAIFFQDTSEFNVATSSLHALSNSMAMSRTDKQSPHSSPRLARRSVTPNLCSVANLVQTNDIYASQMQHHQPPSQATSIASSVSSNSNGNSAAGKAYNAARSSAGSTMQPVCFSQANLNRMSAPAMSTTSAIPSHQHQQCAVNKPLNKAQSAEINDGSHLSQDAMAPPLPPRKMLPIVDNVVNRMLKPSNAPSAPSHSNLMSSTNATSSENITTCELDVPQTEAPPIPKHNAVKSNPVDHVFEDDLKHIHLSGEENGEKVIVGPAETISGIIDTRPIDARKPLATSHTSAVNDKETILVTPNGANNLYHLKMGGNGQQQATQPDQVQQQQSNVQKHPSNQTRHQSFPNHSNSVHSPSSGAHASMPSKSQTTPHFGLEQLKSNTSTTSTSLAATSSRSNANISHTTTDDIGTSFDGPRRDGQQQQPLLYENITINNKDCNVPYENINLEYIARLMNEGYSKENVITALGISRNNIEMACDILHEFVSKSSV